MAETPYDILRVGRDATPEQIRGAYRRLARTLHPDLNPGDRTAEERFKWVSAAYDLLGDPDRRARFDRGEIDASGAERPRQTHFYRDFAGAAAGAGPHPYASDAGFADVTDADDLLAALFGRAGARGARARMRGGDLRARLALDFLEAVNGTTKR